MFTLKSSREKICRRYGLEGIVLCYGLNRVRLYTQSSNIRTSFELLYLSIKVLKLKFLRGFLYHEPRKNNFEDNGYFLYADKHQMTELHGNNLSSSQTDRQTEFSRRKKIKAHNIGIKGH